MSIEAVMSIRPIHTGEAVRSTVHAASRSTEPMRTQIAKTLIAMPRSARRSAPRPIRMPPSVRPAASRKLRGPPHAGAVQHVARDDAEGRQAVDDAAPEADGRRLLEVARRDRDLADPPGHPGRDDLGDQLLVEHEVVAVQPVWDRLEQPAAVGAKARVVLGQMETEREVLEACQEPVADVLPARHATREWVTEESAAEHQVVR